MSSLDKNSRNSYLLNVDEVFLGFSFKNLSRKSMCKLFSKEKSSGFSDCGKVT